MANGATNGREFTVNLDGLDFRVTVNPECLREFEQHGVSVMDREIARLSETDNDNGFPPVHTHPLGVIGTLMYEGLVAGNMRKVVLCALWLASRHPGFTGMDISAGSFHFLADGDALNTHFLLPQPDTVPARARL